MQEYNAKVCTPDMVQEVWVHGNCPDGTGAAVVALLFYYKYKSPSTPTIVTLHHGGQHPDATNKRVVVFDFGFDEPTLLNYLKTAEAFAVLDHHESNKSVLEKYSTHCTFNNDHSGAWLAWNYFFGQTEPTPMWVQYIEDRDLWKWKLEGTKAFGSFVNYYTDKKPETLFKLFYPIQSPFGGRGDLKDYSELLSKGEMALTVERGLIQSQLVGVIRSRFLGLPCGVLNATCLISDTCDAFLTQNQQYNLVLAYRFDAKLLRFSFSLRSREGSNVDCIPLAQKFGGGGHKHAAGFSLDGRESLLNFLERNI